MSLQVISTPPIQDTVYYPDTDGKPMGESDIHREWMFQIIHVLRRFFAGQQVYVTGDLLLYYEQGNPRKFLVPDCFVVRGVAQGRRRVYKLWEEGKGPEVVFEVSSRSTQCEDLGPKMRLYAQLGVQEYYIYDPTAEYLDPPLAAFQLMGSGPTAGFVPMEPVNDELRVGELAFVPGAGEPPEFVSPILGLRLTLDDDLGLEMFDLATGERLLTDEEARQRAETAQQRAEAAQAQAEAENARLREELRRLLGERDRTVE